MKKLVVFSGAGISAESGIKTFRDSDGLWEEYEISEVATPEAWMRNPALVSEFYNLRRKQVLQSKPNQAHISLVDLEKYFDVQIITQNIDDLHERAGSTNVLHLHGEIKKSRSTSHPHLIYDIEGWQLKLGDKCEKGSQLRPHIVWFGEEVPNMKPAYDLIKKADILIVVGSSLSVYPAAGLVFHASDKSMKYLIDPGEPKVTDIENLKIYKESAGTGVPKVVKELIELPGFAEAKKTSNGK